MWWFSKDRRKELWDQKIEWPIGDIEAAHRIREICRSAADSAEMVGRIADGTGTKRRSDRKKNRQATERYERAAKSAMEVVMKISDDLMRDSAVRQIVALCMTAKDAKTARILFRAIQAPSISEEVLKEHPVLRGE
jgi:hypothetical protein